jgi:hypothetical protein
MGEEKEGFGIGVLIGIALMIGTQIVLPFIQNPQTLSTISLLLMIILILLSAIMPPLRIFRRRKKDFSLYQQSLVEGATWCFMIFQIGFVFLGNKPIWSLVF